MAKVTRSWTHLGREERGLVKAVSRECASLGYDSISVVEWADTSPKKKSGPEFTCASNSDAAVVETIVNEYVSTHPSLSLETPSDVSVQRSGKKITIAYRSGPHSH